MEFYVPARVPAIIENIDDATIPAEKPHLDLTRQERQVLARCDWAMRQATVSRFYVAETWIGPRNQCAAFHKKQGRLFCEIL